MVKSSWHTEQSREVARVVEFPSTILPLFNHVTLETATQFSNSLIVLFRFIAAPFFLDTEMR